MAMSQIIDVNQGVVGYINNNQMYNFFIEVAEKEKLQFLKSFFDNGFSLNIPEIVADIESIEWPTGNDSNLAAAGLVEALLLAKGGLVIITQE